MIETQIQLEFWQQERLKRESRNIADLVGESVAHLLETSGLGEFKRPPFPQLNRRNIEALL